ncbi:MAG: TonB-dependent receptor [Phycisphaerales bacterium]|nr:TonB-dependent receptor [Phycisphaerales bacterium]
MTDRFTVAALCALGVAVSSAWAQDAPPEQPPTEQPPPQDVGDSPEAPESPQPPAESQPQRVVRFEPIVVTARKWEELLRDVPGNVDVLNESFLEDSGVRTMRDASFFVPNLFINEFSSRRLTFPTMRGVGSGIGDPAVTTYIDGVPQLTNNSTNLPLIDVERIEFLRGPQGTLYGRNSIGGVINILTKRPSNEPEFRVGGMWGNYSLQEYDVSANVPLIEDELFASFSGLFSKRDGYTENLATGNDVDFRESFFGRGQILWTPSEQSEFRLSIFGETSDDGGFVLSELNGLRRMPHRINQDFEGRADRDLFGAALTWNYYGESVDFVSISAFEDWEIHETSDFDFSIIDGIRRRTEESQYYFSQEFRLSSAEGSELALGDEMQLRWLAGLSVFVADSDRLAANNFRPGGAGILFPPAQVGLDTQFGNFDDFGIAGFGQATLQVNPKLDLTAGLRYDYEHKEATVNHTFETGGFTVLSTTTSIDRDFDQVVPMFGATYDFADNVTAYGSAAMGFKAGGFNLNAPTGRLAFDQETSWTYEGGLKTTFLDERLAINASAFYIDWDDLQLSLFDAMAGGYIANAASATSRGFELELNIKPAEGWDLFAGLGYTDAEFENFIDPYGTDVSGRKLAFVPDRTWNLGAQYTGTINSTTQWYARGEYVGVGTYYYDAGNRASESFELANFRLGVRSGNVSVEGWIRNAFDQDYVLVAFQPSPVDPSVFVGESGAPQTFGVTVNITF